MEDENRKAFFAGQNQNAHLLSKAYFDKQSGHADYLRGKAESQRDLAKHLHSKNDTILGIMNGTPILIGHHSENRHRNQLERIHNDERKGYEASDYAKTLDKRADNKTNSYAVSANDPDAVTKLKNRIKGFEEEKAGMKAKLKTAPDGSNFTDGTKANLRMYMSALTVNIRSTKKRLENLESTYDIPETHEESQSDSGVSYKVDQTDNRVRIYFDGKPSEEIRTRLKSRAWRWSPYNKAWQKQISNDAIEQAKSYL